MNIKLFLVILLNFMIIAVGCQKQEKIQLKSQVTDNKNKSNSNEKIKDGSYCAKSFKCKLNLVTTEQAKHLLLSKKDAIIKHCEELMTKMPNVLRREYEKCVNVPCGKELEKCVENAAERAAKELGLLKKNTNDKNVNKNNKLSKNTTQKKAIVDTKDATKLKNNKTKDSTKTSELPPIPEPSEAQLRAMAEKFKKNPPKVRVADTVTGLKENIQVDPKKIPPVPPGVRLPSKPDIEVIQHR